MKNTLLKTAVLGVLAACVMNANVAGAAVNVTVDPGAVNLGYMNVFELPSNGGAFVFGSPWGIADLIATYSGSNVTLQPNSINDPSPFWYVGGAPGPGNKSMEANLYAEPAGSLPGQTVIFTGNVLSNTLTSAHSTIAFVKDFAPDFSSFNISTVALPASGTFSVSLATVNDPARHVQWGFQMTGPCVWISNLPQFGAATIAPVQPVPVESTTWGGIKSLFN